MKTIKGVLILSAKRFEREVMVSLNIVLSGQSDKDPRLCFVLSVFARSGMFWNFGEKQTEFYLGNFRNA